MAQTILSNKQSTSGSPYVIYTVNVTPSNRTLSTVDLTVQITAHLKNADSSLGTGSGYGIKGKLTVNGQDKWFDGASGNGPIIKGTGSSWSGTGNHTTAAYTYTITGLSWDTTSLSASFYAIRTSGNTSNAGYLKTTDCTAITIDRANAPSTIQEIVGGGGTTDYTPVIKWTPYDSNFKFYIKFYYGSWTYSTDFIYPYTTSQHSYSGYTIRGADVAPYMSGSSGTFTAILYTYDISSGSYIGESSKQFTVTLNPNYKPSGSIGAFSDAGGIIPQSWGIFVQGKSKLSFVSGSASTGSSITGYSTVVNGTTYTTQNITTGVVNSSGSANLTVTDSRGRTGTASSSYSVVAYSNPTISLSGYRCSSSGTAADDGTYFRYTISGQIQSCKNGSTEKNSISEIKIGYRVAGTNNAYTYTTLSVSLGSTANNRISFSKTDTVFGGNLSTANNYDIRVYVKDGLNIEAASNANVTAAFKLVDYKADGTGIAIGKKATVSNQVEVNLPVDLNSTLNVDGTINGNKIVLLTSANSDGNFNNITNSGIYGIRVSPVNGPVGNWGTLYVQNTDLSGTLYQIYIADIGTIYKRHWNSGNNVWGSWAKLDAGNADYATSAGSATNATNATNATKANYLNGFSGATGGQGWGNQTGTFIHGQNDSTGGSMAFRRDNPNGGQLSMIIDGRYYQNEGQYQVVDWTMFERLLFESPHWTMGSSGSKTDNFTFTCSGYIPIALAGFRCHSSDYETYMAFAWCEMSPNGEGGTIYYRVRNHRAASAGDTYIQAWVMCLKKYK